MMYWDLLHGIESLCGTWGKELCNQKLLYVGLVVLVWLMRVLIWFDNRLLHSLLLDKECKSLAMQVYSWCCLWGPAHNKPICSV